LTTLDQVPHFGPVLSQGRVAISHREMEIRANFSAEVAEVLNGKEAATVHLLTMKPGLRGADVRAEQGSAFPCQDIAHRL
jgi:hypothetical protein